MKSGTATGKTSLRKTFRRGAVAAKSLLVFHFAVVVAAIPACTPQDIPDYAAPGGSARSQPPVTAPTRAYERPPVARPCYFGPFTLRLDRFEVHAIGEAAPTGREALARILALEEDPDLPPYRFRVATEDGGGEDVICRARAPHRSGDAPE